MPAQSGTFSLPRPAALPAVGSSRPGQQVFVSGAVWTFDGTAWTSAAGGSRPWATDFKFGGD